MDDLIFVPPDLTEATASSVNLTGQVTRFVRDTRTQIQQRLGYRLYDLGTLHPHLPPAEHGQEPLSPQTDNAVDGNSADEGRPADPQDRAFFSMTDRADQAVCVVSEPGLGLGVDLELVEPRSQAFVADYLTGAEQRFVGESPDRGEHGLRANLVWCGKESALKVLRTGLRRDTRSVEVSFPDGPPVDGWIQSLKFAQDLATARLLGELLASNMAPDSRTEPAVVLPVPLHRKRLAERGYNQALEIARSLRRQGYRLYPSQCRRHRATSAQSDLPASARKGNVRNAFSTSGSLEGRRVLLIDDVMTTGATLNELAGTLKNAGAERVEARLIARAV